MVVTYYYWKTDLLSKITDICQNTNFLIKTPIKKEFMSLQNFNFVTSKWTQEGVVLVHLINVPKDILTQEKWPFPYKNEIPCLEGC